MPTIVSATWPGINQTDGFDFPFTGGARPSTCTLLSPTTSPSISDRGNLTFTQTGDSGSAAITFVDCAVERASLQRDGSGNFWSIPILDRRWKWAFGEVSGDYNIPDGSGGYRNEKTPQELAQLCFEAFGETDADVARLPNDTRPRRKWEYSNARNALEAICGELGCWVVLNPINNKAEIWPLGVGDPLPVNLRGTGVGASLSARAKPSSLLFVGGRTLYETDWFVREPYGLDTDGKWKPIDDLSYKPTLGWAVEPVNFPNVTGTYTVGGQVLQRRDLALSTVWKNYRITGNSADGVVPFQNFTGPSSLDDVEFESHRALLAESPQGEFYRLPHEVIIDYIGNYAEASNTVLLGPYPGNTQIDGENNLLRFGEQIYKVDAGGLAPAVITLRTACTFRVDGEFEAYQLSRAFGAAGTSPQMVRRTDVRRSVIDIPAADNGPLLQPIANKFLDAAARSYDLSSSSTIDYDGIVPLAPNGLVRQITWSGGNGRLARTVASTSREHNPFALTVTEAERRRTLETLVDRSDKQAELSERRPLTIEQVERAFIA